MPSINTVIGDLSIFQDSYTSLAESIVIQHCENYFNVCRKMKHSTDEQEKLKLQDQITEEMDYFLHGRFDRDFGIMCNSEGQGSHGEVVLYKLDNIIEDEAHYPLDTIEFYIES